METTAVNYLEILEKVVTETIAPNAQDVDQSRTFPRTNVEAMGKVGLLGLISAPEVGGLGQGHRAAALVVERIARECASTALEISMHYCGTAVRLSRPGST